MSGAQHLPVTPEKVTGVLLADGWHPVALGTFTVGRLSFSDDSHAVAGYRFEELSDTSLYRSVTLTGPLEAVLGVRQVTSRRPPQQQGGIGERPSPNGHAVLHPHPKAPELSSYGVAPALS